LERAILNLRWYKPSTKSSTIAANTTMKAKTVDADKSHPVITEDHPVVQRILAHIEKEIKPESLKILHAIVNIIIKYSTKISAIGDFINY
jgi:hypothetical protein